MFKDDLGDRMKAYEKASEIRFLPENGPVVARLDGKNFSKLTKKLVKPYDLSFIQMMDNATKLLMNYSNADLAYAESDEITLVWLKHPFFDGKMNKINSVLASAAGYFVGKYYSLNNDPNNPTAFDCRSFQVPNFIEAANAIIWRQQDCKRNSIQSMARHYFSHKDCDGKSIEEMKQMLDSLNIDFSKWVKFERFSLGLFLKRIVVNTKFDKSKINELPEKHNARTNPQLVVETKQVKEIIDKLNVQKILEDVVENSPEIRQ